MNPLQTLPVAMRALLRNKTRSFLTTLGSAAVPRDDQRGERGTAGTRAHALPRGVGGAYIARCQRRSVAPGHDQNRRELVSAGKGFQ